MLKRAIERESLPFQWVAADELYGDSPDFRDGVAALEKWYFTEIKCSTLIWKSRPEVVLPEWKGRGRHPIRLRLRHVTDHPVRVDDLVPTLPKDAWTTATIKEGSKGPIVCRFAFLRLVESRANLPGPEVWLIIRRNLDDPSIIKFYFSNAPVETPLIELVRISGMRWPIEIIFEEDKGEVGLDQYETRSWLGWHHHMLLVSLAHHFLVRLRIRFHDKSPALTVYQVRLLLSAVLPKPVFNIAAALLRVRYYQKRNYQAYCSHRKSILARLAAFRPTLRCNTNLSEAYLIFSIVTANQDPTIASTCTQPFTNPAEIVTDPVKINNYTFTRTEFNGAAAGNLYDQISYRTVYNSNCFEVIFLFHSGNIGNYSPGTVVEFDRAALLKKFEGVLATFLAK